MFQCCCASCRWFVSICFWGGGGGGGGGGEWRLYEIWWYRYSRACEQRRANVQVCYHFSIPPAKVVCPEISNSEFKTGYIDARGVPPRVFPSPSLAFYRDIGADRSTLKLHFTLSNYTQAKVASGAFPFFPSHSAFLSVRLLLSEYSSPALRLFTILPVYFRAVPPFVFIRAIGKGVRSRAFYLFSCFTAWCFRTNVSSVKFGFI